MLSPEVVAVATAVVSGAFGLLGSQAWQHRRESRKTAQIDNAANLGALREAEMEMIRDEIQQLKRRDKERDSDLRLVRGDLNALVRYQERYRLWAAPYDTSADPAPDIPDRLKHLLEP